MTNETKPNRNYKDTIFRMLFSDKNNLLSLYNAINESDYNNVDDLEIVTLENAIYMSVKNDLAFIIDLEINMFEHQSTICPNMPLRNLFYISKELERLYSNTTLYGTRRIKIPVPRFVVFYNGEEKQPEKQILKLSNMYAKECDDPELELKVTVYNVNSGYNTHIVEACKVLKEYMIYVEKVREYKSYLGFGEAVEKAVNECIKDNVLADFLVRNKSEVIAMNIFEYDEEKVKRILREQAIEDGIEIGIEQGILRGKAEAIITVLQELGDVPDFVQQQVMAQKDLDILMSWFKVAIKATEIEEFIEGIK